jgi:hypothetical protein
VKQDFSKIIIKAMNHPIAMTSSTDNMHKGQLLSQLPAQTKHSDHRRFVHFAIPKLYWWSLLKTIPQIALYLNRSPCSEQHGSICVSRLNFSSKTIVRSPLTG